ncbi:MAG: gluconate 2-dehydrogenase subunit 3 family protein [Acidobacteria bacterium]|nr:gluconate 2-dehydrogenase subunit 3 family protein [Acidobacteriota bacterium]
MKKRQGDAETERRGEGVSPDVSRREMVKLTAGAMVVPALPQAKRRATAKPAKFFTADELKMVDELGELIIPADDHSPGAREAKCADYIDARLAETWDEASKQQWREGLALVNRLSTEMHGQPFLKATSDQRIALLERIAHNEANPQTPEEKFFGTLKGHIAHAYYTSKIGIQQELQYKGNTYQREFSGVDVSKK